jgi:hypothetical protein
MTLQPGQQQLRTPLLALRQHPKSTKGISLVVRRSWTAFSLAVT